MLVWRATAAAAARPSPPLSHAHRLISAMATAAEDVVVAGGSGVSVAIDSTNNTNNQDITEADAGNGHVWGCTRHHAMFAPISLMDKSVPGHINPLQAFAIRRVATRDRIATFKDPREKQRVVAENSLWLKLSDLPDGRFCPRCWQKRAFCLCPYATTIPLRHNILIYMHFREFRRGSNTGKLVLMSHDKTQVLFYGLEEEENRVAKLLKEWDPARTLVLYPSPDSVKVSDFIARFNNNSNNDNNAPSPTTEHVADGTSKRRKSLQEGDETGLSSLTGSTATVVDNTDNAATTAPSNDQATGDLTAHVRSILAAQATQPLHLRRVNGGGVAAPSLLDHSDDTQDESKRGKASDIPPLNIVVLDGTWGQAGTLNRNLKDICDEHHITPPTRVALDEKLVSLFTLRKQTQPDRISTVESVYLLLKELGEPPENRDPLLSLLKWHVNIMTKQTGGKAVYEDPASPHGENNTEDADSDR